MVDNLRVHHSKLLQEWLTENKAFIEIFYLPSYSPVQEWLAENKAFIEIFYLPSYSPDLNPDELLNRDLKAALSKTPAAKRNGELEEHAKSHMRSIQKQPEKIKALFHKESVKYAG